MRDREMEEEWHLKGKRDGNQGTEVTCLTHATQVDRKQIAGRAAAVSLSLSLFLSGKQGSEREKGIGREMFLSTVLRESDAGGEKDSYRGSSQRVRARMQERTGRRAVCSDSGALFVLLWSCLAIVSPAGVSSLSRLPSRPQPCN